MASGEFFTAKLHYLAWLSLVLKSTRRVRRQGVRLPDNRGLLSLGGSILFPRGVLMNKQKAQETALWVFAIWALGLATLIAWHVIPEQKTGWDVFVQVVGVATAIGTVGALGWAMYVSYSTSREQSRRDFEGAVILAAGMVDLLGHALGRLGQSSAAIAFIQLPPDYMPVEARKKLDATRDFLLRSLN